LRHRSGRVTRIDGAISGTPFLALVLGYLGYLRRETMLVPRTAALCGHDPRALRTGADVLVLRSIHPTVEAAEAVIRAPERVPLLTETRAAGACFASSASRSQPDRLISCPQ